MNSLKEQIVHIVDPTNPTHSPLFLPRISVSNADNEDIRPFQSTDDIDRVMDYANMPDPPQPCLVMHCEAPGSGLDDGEGDGTDGKDDDGGVVFPKRLAHLRGGYIFLCIRYIYIY
jgi:hypothetical protein